VPGESTFRKGGKDIDTSFDGNPNDEAAEENRRRRTDRAATAADDFLGLGAENAAGFSDSSVHGVRRRCELPVRNRIPPKPESAAGGKSGRRIDTKSQRKATFNSVPSKLESAAEGKPERSLTVIHKDLKDTQRLAKYTMLEDLRKDTQRLKDTRRWNDARRLAEMDMLLDVYALGSTNVAQISSRARLLTNMFLDFINLRIDVTKLTEWDAVPWIRSRVNGGGKTAG